MTTWPLHTGSGRLLHDRELALVDSFGTAMRLQTHPKMALIHPTIDLDKRILTLTPPDTPQLELNLDCNANHRQSVVKVCGGQCGGEIWGDNDASEWFSQILGITCWLSRFSKTDAIEKVFRDPTVAFANERPLLLISH